MFKIINKNTKTTSLTEGLQLKKRLQQNTGVSSEYSEVFKSTYFEEHFDACFLLGGSSEKLTLLIFILIFNQRSGHNTTHKNLINYT